MEDYQCIWLLYYKLSCHRRMFRLLNRLILFEVCMLPLHLIRSGGRVHGVVCFFFSFF